MDNKIKEIYGLVKKEFPITIVSNLDGSIKSVEYKTEWKSGSTEAVENEDGTIDYVEKYTEESLTKAEIKVVENWVKENVSK